MTSFGAMDKRGEVKVRVLFFRLDEKKRSGRGRLPVRAVLLLETNVFLTFVFFLCFRFEPGSQKRRGGSMSSFLEPGF